jgi:hypothetical protein
MGGNALIALYAKYREMARQGVEYRLKGGASCPACGRRLRVYASNGSGVKYCKCKNPTCFISKLDFSVKAVEQN